MGLSSHRTCEVDMTNESIQFPNDLNKLKTMTMPELLVLATQLGFAPAGLDLGNGFVNLSLLGCVAKIPAAYSTTQPKGAISGKSGNRLKDKSFCEVIDGQEYWFGTDVLGSPSIIRELDEFKYKPDHIQILWIGVLSQWSRQHKVSLSDLPLIKVVCGMPAELHADASTRKTATAAYRTGLKSRKGSDKDKDNRLMANGKRFTSQHSLTVPEAASYGRVRGFDPDYMIVHDMGYGTDDTCLFKKGEPEPLARLTEPNGMVTLYASQNVNQNLAELAYIRKQGDNQALQAHINSSKNRLQLLHRRLPESQKRNTGLTILGGGAVMANGSFKTELQQVFSPVVVKDEYETARIFEDIGRGLCRASKS